MGRSNRSVSSIVGHFVRRHGDCSPQEIETAVAEGRGSASQEAEDTLVSAMARLLLHYEDSLNISALETEFMAFIQTGQGRVEAAMLQVSCQDPGHGPGDPKPSADHDDVLDEGTQDKAGEGDSLDGHGEQLRTELVRTQRLTSHG